MEKEQKNNKIIITMEQRYAPFTVVFENDKEKPKTKVKINNGVKQQKNI